MLTMTSSASQYLHPDYLQPLPTTLDAKKSPLALLAQTCSSIGKDSTPSKPLISSADKKESSGNGKSSPHKSSSSSSQDERKSLSNSCTSDRRGGSPNDSKPGFRTVAPKDIPPLVPISSSSPSGPRSPATSVNGDSKGSSDRERESTSVTSVIQHPVSAPSSGSQSNSRISVSCGNGLLLEVNHQESASATASSSSKSTSSAPPTSSSSHHHGLGTVLKPDSLSLHPGSLPPSLGAYAGCGSYPYLGHSVPLDPLTAQAYSGLAHANALGLSAAHKTGFLPGAHGPASAVGGSPYVGYARVKTATGATTLVPICRDPYCTNCQMTLQSAHVPSAVCGAGCTQCTHDKSQLIPSSLSGLGSSAGMPVLSLAGTPGLPSVSTASALSMYPHGLGALSAHHGLPYVCNWVSGSDYCGKRFTTSEELLHHLRTHTSSTDPLLASYSMSTGLPLSGLQAAAAAAAACPSHYPTGSLSPNSLRRAYPTSLSPNSLAANRFHPYKTALSPYSAPPVPGLPLQSVGAYYSPYSLYGQRLGAT